MSPLPFLNNQLTARSPLSSAGKLFFFLPANPRFIMITAHLGSVGFSAQTVTGPVRAILAFALE